MSGLRRHAASALALAIFGGISCRSPFVVAPDGTLRIEYLPSWRMSRLRAMSAAR